MEQMRVSHETIYLSLFVQTRGGLRRELASHLRSGRLMRHPRGVKAPTGRGQITNTVPISARPVEVADRAVPGHWEGDLVFGRRPSGWHAGRTQQPLRAAVRPARRVQGSRGADRAHRRGRAAPGAAVAVAAWDRGHEMAEHATFTVDTGVQVYFCDPRSPWQRGSNENTNRLLRQYLTKTGDLRVHTQADLDAIADRLNTRPRKTLGWRTPAAALAEVIASSPTLNPPGASTG